VAVDRVLLERQARQLREELRGQAGTHHEPQRHRGHVDHDDLVELVADALGGHDGEPAVHAFHRLCQRRVGFQ
jgi:LmbE family N-acetylglucosaminyl deacetylase